MPDSAPRGDVLLLKQAFASVGWSAPPCPQSCRLEFLCDLWLAAAVGEVAALAMAAAVAGALLAVSRERELLAASQAPELAWLRSSAVAAAVVGAPSVVSRVRELVRLHPEPRVPLP